MTFLPRDPLKFYTLEQKERSVCEAIITAFHSLRPQWCIKSMTVNCVIIVIIMLCAIANLGQSVTQYTFNIWLLAREHVHSTSAISQVLATFCVHFSRSATASHWSCSLKYDAVKSFVLLQVELFISSYFILCFQTHKLRVNQRLWIFFFFLDLHFSPAPSRKIAEEIVWSALFCSMRGSMHKVWCVDSHPKLFACTRIEICMPMNVVRFIHSCQHWFCFKNLCQCGNKRVLHFHSHNYP